MVKDHLVFGSFPLIRIAPQDHYLQGGVTKLFYGPGNLAPIPVDNLNALDPILVNHKDIFDFRSHFHGVNVLLFSNIQKIFQVL